MIKYWIILASLASGISLHAQCSELFFSEYVEGYYNNKALEIYNPTKQTIALKDYRITTWHNGTGSFISWYCDTLYGTIGPNQTRVVVINKRDSSASGLDTVVDKKLMAKANIWLSQTMYASMSMNFNGDDPISLEKKVGASWQPVDIIGKIAEKPQLPSQPGALIGWSDSFPYNNGLGTIYTKDHSLVRKPSVTGGVKFNPNYFNPSAEWKLLPVNRFDSLGTHRCACNSFAAGTDQTSLHPIRIFPNPAVDYVLVSGCRKLALINLCGQPMNVQSSEYLIDGMRHFHLELNQIPPGMYYLMALTESGAPFTFPLLKK